MIYTSCRQFALRSIEVSDLSIIQQWRNSPLLRQFFREYRELSFSQIQNWYEAMIADPKFEMFIISSESGESLGVAGLTYIDFVNRHADLHFYIGKNDVWIDHNVCISVFPLLLDYGYNVMNLHKLWAEIYENDQDKIAFFERFGFSRDAVLRDHYYLEGSYVASFIYSLLRHEYSI